MKTHKGLILGLTAFVLTAVTSCKKETLKGVQSNDAAEVYLPAAANENGLFSVLDKGTVVVDVATQTVNFAIPVYRGGFLKHEPFTVDVTVDNSKIAGLISSGALPANTVLLNADSYTLNAKDSLVSKDFIVKGAIVPKVKLNKLADYAGKTVALAIKISNPSKYQVNEKMNTVVIYFDVDQLKKGYLRVPVKIVNPAFEDNYTGWVTNAGLGELKSPAGRSGKDLNFWTSKVTNAHVLQTVRNIPNGDYTLSVWYKSAGTNMYVYVNGNLIPLPATTAWTQINVDFAVTDQTAEFGFKAVNATGNFAVWEPWCDMDDFSLVQRL